MHYHQLKEKKILNNWVEHVMFLHSMKPDIITINTIMSPPLFKIWEEALAFYQKNIFEKIGIKLLLICDVHVTRNGAFPEEKEKYLKELLEKFPFTFMLGAPEVMNRNFVEQPAKPAEPLRCPAGKQYFRIWNDGRVQGCMPYEKLSNMGNIKERNLIMNRKPALCFGMNQCDCGWALSLLPSDTDQTSWWKKHFFKLQNKWGKL